MKRLQQARAWVADRLCAGAEAVWGFADRLSPDKGYQAEMRVQLLRDAANRRRDRVRDGRELKTLLYHLSLACPGNHEHFWRASRAVEGLLQEIARAGDVPSTDSLDYRGPRPTRKVAA